MTENVGNNKIVTIKEDNSTSGSTKDSISENVSIKEDNVFSPVFRLGSDIEKVSKNQKRVTKSEKVSTIEKVSQKVPVEVSFEFLNIGEIDTLNERFQAEVNIESKWRINCNLAENEDIISDYDPKKHWNPKLYVENAIAIREEITYEPTMVGEAFYMTEIKNIKGYFWSKLRLNHFPVDVQELEIVLTSKIGYNELELISDKEKVSFIVFEATRTFRDQQKWKLFRLVTTSDEATYETEKRERLKIKKNTENIMMIKKARQKFKPPKIVAKFYAARRPGFYMMNAFFLVFLITSMTLAIFSINFSLPQFRLLSTYVILLTSVSFKWIVNRSLPPVSYLTSLDAYQISSICFICLLATWHAIVGARDRNLFEPDTAEKLDKWMLLSFGILFVLIQNAYIVWLYYAYDKVRQIKSAEHKYFADHKDQFIPQFTDNLKFHRRHTMFVDLFQQKHYA